MLSETIGERNHSHPESYAKAKAYLKAELEKMGYQVEEQHYKIGEDQATNLVAQRAGSSTLVVVGAHYDSAPGTPGADDNASGCAALLELARALKTSEQGPTVRFVLFANEEPPYFQTEDMGSLVYAAKCAEEQEQIKVMFSLETLGYYSDESESQHFPVGISGYPTTGNFLALISDLNSKEHLSEALGRFKNTNQLPIEGLAAPGFIEGVGWSDHWSFWQHGYPAMMVTDTAPFRNPHYHRSTDTEKTLDFERLSKAVAGLREMLESYD